MSKIISVVIAEAEWGLLEAAAAREGVSVSDAATKMFARGLRAPKVLPADQVLILDKLWAEGRLSSAARSIEKFENNGAAANAQAFQEMVGSSDFKEVFKNLVKANKDREPRAAQPIKRTDG